MDTTARSASTDPPARAHFRLERSEDIATVLRDAASAGEAVAWTDAAGRSGTALLRNDGAVRLLAEGPLQPRGVVRLACVVHGVPVFVRCTMTSDGQLSGPLTAWSADHRAATRATPRRELYLEWCTLEQDGPRMHRVPVIDISSVGARTLHAPGASLFPRRSSFPVALVGPDSFAACIAETKSVTTTAQGVECGLLLYAEDRDSLAGVLQSALLPRVTLRRNVPADRVVELFETSGYLSLRPGCAPTEQWLQIDADDLTRDLVYTSSSGRPVGHISITRAYRNTWLGHQIATVSDDDESLEARHALYLAFSSLPTVLDGSHARVIGYYNRSRPWHRIFFEQFAASVTSPDMAVVYPLDRFEREPAPLDLALPEGVEVAHPTARELITVAELVHDQLPPLLIDAMDIHPARLRTAALHPSYVESPFHRSRDVLVLKVNGHLVGAALCEFASRALSLFNVLNAAQFFFLPGVDPRAQLALHHHVRHAYEQRGVSDPLTVAPPDTFAATHDPAVRLAETMGCIAWSGDGLRAYENYVQLRFAWLSQDSSRNRPISR